MRGKRLFSLLILFFFLLSTTAPVYADAPGYYKFYDLDGLILMKILAGKNGQVYQSVVDGRGELLKEETITMQDDGLKVENLSTFTAAGPDEMFSLRGLEVAGKYDPGWDSEGLDEHSFQTFATSIKADRGESGLLNQEFDLTGDGATFDEIVIYQESGTTGGTVRRFIDLHEAGEERIFEDTTIKGSAYIEEYLNYEPAGNDEGLEAGLETVEETLESDLSVEGGEPARQDLATQAPEGGDESAPVIVLHSDHFAAAVPVGTAAEELAFPAAINLETELALLTGIAIDWNLQSEPAFDPLEEGTYIFLGELLFPESILPRGRILVSYSVQVGAGGSDAAETASMEMAAETDNPAPPEDSGEAAAVEDDPASNADALNDQDPTQEGTDPGSDDLEDLVEGREDGIDKESDEKSHG